MITQSAAEVDVKLSLAFLAIYFLFLWLGMSAKSTELKGSWWFFLRAFFPNWKFFHALGMAPRLYVHFKRRNPVGEHEGDWSDWLLVYPRVQRRVLHVFHNPEVNLRLAYQNLVEHLVADLNALPEGADASVLVTYQLIERLAGDALRVYKSGDEQLMFQFEIRMEEPLLNRPSECLRSEVMLVSREMVL